MKLLIDMNLSPVWVEVLAQSGIAAIHWASIGARDADDAQIMEHARRHGMIVLTHDLDFGTLLAHSRHNGPSVVQIRTQDLAPAVLAPVLARALFQFETVLAEGAVVTILPDRSKVRILPL
jgi:predicted nuclease of predicted toxin-antitoxin system